MSGGAGEEEGVMMGVCDGEDGDDASSSLSVFLHSWAR